MINLIKNEIFKITHKKSIYIILTIILAFVVLLNLIWNMEITNSYSTNINYNYEIEETKKHIDELNKNDLYYYDKYCKSISRIDTLKLADTYSGVSWKQKLIFDIYNDLSYQYYLELYITKNESAEKELLAKLNRIKTNLDNNSWTEYVNNLIMNTNNTIENYKKTLEQETDQNEITKLKIEIEYQKYLLKLYKYRIDNNIEFDSSYLDTALQNLENNIYSQITYKYKENMSDEEKKDWENTNRIILTNEYAIENQKDVLSNHGIKLIFEVFFKEYNLFIILFIILIAGSIVNSEYNGTIKTLLTVPYSRSKILFAKFVTVLLSILFIIFYIVLCELLVGGLIMGFSSLKDPSIIYNYSTHSISTVSVFKYFAINFIYNLPLFILVGTIAFMLSVIINSTALAVVLPLGLVTFAGVINSLAYSYDVKFLRYFITPNWDFSQYMFGQSAMYKYVNLKFSIIICIIYFAIMLFLSFMIFKKKNIKNV